MRYSESKQGRVFVVRLEDGDVVHEAIEKFAMEKGIRAACVMAVGGADDGSKLVVGPEQDRGKPVIPMETVLKNAHEVAGVGTIFPARDGKPVLHMHMACGRKNRTITGCVRRGVKTWHVLEVIVMEIVGTSAARMPDPATGFDLLQP